MSKRHEGPAGERRLRLRRIIRMAGIYRNCDLKTLAKSLKRDPTRLIPDSGNPKLDLVFGLARLLDWPVSEVIRGLHPAPRESTASKKDPGSDPFELDDRFQAVHREGRSADALAIARRMTDSAANDVQRLLASARQYAAHEAAGDYQRALHHLGSCRGIRGIDGRCRELMIVNLANAYYSADRLTEAESLSSEMIRAVAGDSVESRQVVGFAHYVRGNARRRLARRLAEGCRRIAVDAHADLEKAREVHLELHEADSDRGHHEIAETSLGGMIEMRATLGCVEPESAVDTLLGSEPLPTKPRRLESAGWWAVFASNVALHQMKGEARLAGLLRSGRRLREVAERLGHGAFHAEAARIGLLARERSRADDVDPGNWVMGRSEVRTLIGTMGRLPVFQETGWRILLEENVLPETAGDHRSQS